MCRVSWPIEKCTAVVAKSRIGSSAILFRVPLCCVDFGVEVFAARKGFAEKCTIATRSSYRVEASQPKKFVNK